MSCTIPTRDEKILHSEGTRKKSIVRILSITLVRNLLALEENIINFLKITFHNQRIKFSGYF